MEETLTGAARHPKLKKRLVFDDEYMMTEEEIEKVLHRWGLSATDVQVDIEDGTPLARVFLDTLAAIRCEEIGL